MEVINNMRIAKLLLTMTLAFAFSFSSVQAEEISIKDIDKSSGFAREAIIALAEKNIISGDAAGHFNPGKSISRAELVALLVKTLELDTTDIPQNATFKDVPKSHWAFKYVEAAYKAGIISGISSNEFGINNVTNREQIAVMFVRALNLVDQSYSIELNSINTLKDKSNISGWAQREVDIALVSGLMTGVGNASFAPKGNATKEQAAVVLSRSMQDEKVIIEKINAAYGISKETKLILNGDVISSKFYTVDENKNIFVSKQFIDKNIQQSDDVASRYTENKELYVETSPTYGTSGIASIWFKVGSLNAYKNAGANPNYTGQTPYAIEDKLTDNVVMLEVAPIEKDDTIFVPLKELAQMLNIQYTANAIRNEVVLENSLTPKYPNFNNAVKNGVYEKYIGNMDMLMEMIMTDVNTQDYMKTSMDSKSIVNKDAMYAHSILEFEINGEAPEQIETKDIITKDKVYSLDVDNMWIEYDREEWENELGQGTANETEARLPAGFLTGYSSLPIQKAGTVNVNGISADKYVVKVGIDGLQYFMEKDQYDQIKELFGSAYNGTEKYEVEFYVADHQVIRQVVKFNGIIRDDASAETIDFKMTIDVSYSNIGVEGKIELPNASEIKQPE
jgi:hypothetical protein